MDIYSFTNKANKKSNTIQRINVFMIVSLLLLALIVGKLVVIQIIDSEKYRILAKKQSQTREVIYPTRGIIYDCNMNPMVANVHSVSVIADPYKIKNPEAVSELMAAVFGKNKTEYSEKLQDKNNSAFYLERRVELNDLKGLDTVKIEGLNVFMESARFYNYGTLAAHIIGFNDIENKGVSGIELALNKELSGKEGYMISRKDGKGFKRPDLDFIQKEPENGSNIILTIDNNIQKIAEEELLNGIKNYNASRGKVVVASVKTGEILAMCNYPTFNPNDIKKEDTAGMKNAVISDIFEPGSTFKLITSSAIIEENLMGLNDAVNTENGSYKVYGMDIVDSYPASSLTFQQVIERSSNIGVVKLSQKVGAERFFKYARDYGFGIYTGLELNGENKGYLKRPIDFTNGSLEFMSIGYQVAVNSLQLTMAYAAAANKGLLMKPYVVKKVISQDGTVIAENIPSPVRQVISEQTSEKLRQIFTGVVETGTGTDARIENVKVAGKTGTTQKLVEGEYSSSSHISSFIGFFPADNPEIIITVILDDPKNGYYGGKVSAPVFQKIATRILAYTDIKESQSNEFLFTQNNREETKNISASITENMVPNLIDLKVKDAVEVLNEMNIRYELDKENIAEEKGFIVSVSRQEPAPGVKVGQGEPVKLFVVSRKIDNESFGIVPDVRGKSLRKAINKLVSEGFVVDINGSGEVIDLFPKPGSKILNKSKIILFCRNENI
jgi:cell division protein FtsI/penicillin-binding protein 2